LREKKKQFNILSKDLAKENEIRKEELENLKNGIKALKLKYGKRKKRCNFGWKCKNVVRRFDHSYLNCKINAFPTKSTSQSKASCDFCDKILGSQGEIQAHMIT
jgi:hypothetical protein